MQDAKDVIVMKHFTDKNGSDGSALVGILDLQVILAEESPNAWVAQGIEIDYAAGGGSLEEAKSNFEHGIVATVHEHLNTFGSIKQFMCQAPNDAWFDLLLKHDGDIHLYSRVIVHDLVGELTKADKAAFPFDAIKYLSVTAAHAH